MKTTLKEESKSDFEEKNILPKTIIIFDGHGFTNKKDVSLIFKHYFLCDEGKTVSSDTFNNIIKQLVKDKGTTDLSIFPNNFDAQREHFLFELTNHQKIFSSNLRKALALNIDGSYKLKEIAKVIEDQNKSYNLKIQFTNFHPITKHQLVYVRLENKEPIRLSTLEKLVFPIFIDTNDPVMESCGMALEKFESEAVGIWGACREIDENII
jgi:hypothetical protein